VIKSGTRRGIMMRIAIPVVGGKLSMHFGHCDEFALVDVDPESKAVIDKKVVSAPEHEPDLLPRWLREKGAAVIIAGGMGRRAQDLFADSGIQVIVGAAESDVDSIVANYLEGRLTTGPNVCDH
jgi:predicted Fe-Mo cluster-binding NifX family protein